MMVDQAERNNEPRYSDYSSAIYLSSSNLQLTFRRDVVGYVRHATVKIFGDGMTTLEFPMPSGAVPAELVAIVALAWKPYVSFMQCPHPDEFGVEVLE
jgi:hypothetical protein